MLNFSSSRVMSQVQIYSVLTFPKTNTTLEHPPFEEVFPIEHGDFPASHVSFHSGMA